MSLIFLVSPSLKFKQFVALLTILLYIKVTSSSLFIMLPLMAHASMSYTKSIKQSTLLQDETYYCLTIFLSSSRSLNSYVAQSMTLNIKLV